MRSPVAVVPTWPEEFRHEYRARGWWSEETIGSFILDRTARFASNTAVVGRNAHGDEARWTYAELAEQADAAACRFLALGITPGDRVVVTLPNVVEYLAVVAGLFRLGALPVFALPTHREVELVQFCSISDAAALVVVGDVDGFDHLALHGRVGEQLRARGLEAPLLVDVREWREVPAPDLALPDVEFGAEASERLGFLQLSGGTTGVSKLIPRAAADYLYSVRESAVICGCDEQTVMLVALPASHNFPMSSPGILGVLDTGGTVVLAKDPSPRTVFTLIEQERVTTTAAVPPLAQAWLTAARRRRPDLSSLDTMQVGGARLADTLAPEIEEVFGVRLQQVFGMAEGLVNYTRDDDPTEIVHTTQGRPISEGDEIRVVDGDDNDVPEGTEGSLLTRGPYTIRGYYLSEAPNRDSFTADGFYRTGDLVRHLPTGHLVVTGRDKDQINRGGEKVATEEIEGLALTHPDVLDAVAVGLPDPYLGERVCLVVRAQPGAERPDVAGHLRSSGLADWKVPDVVEFLDAFPQTHVGKNSRRELRRLLTESLSQR